MTLIVLLGINVLAELVVAVCVTRLAALNAEHREQHARQKQDYDELLANVRRLQQLVNADRS